MRPYPIKVLVVEDSLVAAQLLMHIINSDPDLKVIGHVESGEKALEFLKTNTPDVITMDIVMPNLNGFETTRQIMQKKPIPIVIISASYSQEDVHFSFQAMEAGAVAILEKPRGIYDPLYQKNAKEIIQSIKTISEIKLITRKTNLKDFPSFLYKQTKESTSSKLTSANSIYTSIDAIGIGASLGGPQALFTILSKLPSNFPVPIFIVQHISAGFTQGFVDWLSQATALKISLAKDHEIGLPGHVYIAPEYVHLEIANKSHVMNLIDAPPEEGLKPAVARLFRSMAKVYGPNCAGVILTGMGRDGAEDLLAMKKKGAITIAQDQDSSLMFGMPQQAIAIDAVKQILPLQEIPNMLKSLVKING